MSVKSERITILGSPDFKAYLTEEAAKERISVSELVRRRCEQPLPSEHDERVFAELVATLHTSVTGAKRSLEKGIEDAESVLRELRSKDPEGAGKQRAAAG